MTRSLGKNVAEKVLKKALWGLGAGVAIIIVAALIVPSFLNWNEYRTQVEDVVSSLTGRDVRIAGHITLSTLPTLSLSAEDVTVANHSGGQADHLLRLKSVEGHLGLFALLRGNVSIEKIVLVEPVLALEINQQGQPNWVLGAGSEDPDPQDGVGRQQDFRMDKFTVRQGILTYHDAQRGLDKRIDGINTEISAQNLRGPFTLSGRARHAGQDFKFSGTIGKSRDGLHLPLDFMVMTKQDRVRGDLRGTLVLGQNKAGGTKLQNGFSGKLNLQAGDLSDLVQSVTALAGEAVVQPTLPASGQQFSMQTKVVIDPQQILLTELDFDLGKSKGAGQLSVDLKTVPIIAATLKVNSVDVENWQPWIKWLMDHERTGDNSGTPSLPEAEDAPWNWLIALPDNVNGEATLAIGAMLYNGKIARQLEVVASMQHGMLTIEKANAILPGGADVKITAQTNVITPASVRADKSGQENTTDRIDQKSLSGTIQFNASNLRGFAEWLKFDVSSLPQGQLTGFQFRSDYQLKPEQLVIGNVSGLIDSTRFTGHVSYGLMPSPRWAVALEADRFNVDSYLFSIPDVGVENTDSTEFQWVLPPVLDAMDVEYDVRVARLNYAGIKTRGAHFAGRLQNQTLHLRHLNFANAAGLNVAMTGHGKGLTSQPELDLNFSISGDSLLPLVRQLNVDLPVDARNLGKGAFSGKLGISPEKMVFDVSGALGGTNLKATGNMRSATLKKFPHLGSVDVNIGAKNSSLVSMIQQFGGGLTPPRATDDRPIAALLHLTGSPSQLDVDGKMTIAGGDLTAKGALKQHRPTHDEAAGKGSVKALFEEYDYDLLITLHHPETIKFVRGLGIDYQPSAASLGKLDMKGILRQRNNKYNLLEITGQIGQMKFSGEGDFSSVGQQRHVQLQLTTGEIKADHLLPTTSQKNNEFGQWSRQPMVLDWMEGVDGLLSVNASRLIYQDYIFEQPRFTLTLKDQVLSLTGLTSRLFGGDVEMTGHFARSGNTSQKASGAPLPSLNLDVRLTNASLAKAAKTMAGINPVTSNVNFSGKYNASGLSQYALMSSLSGKGTMTTSSGVINGIDIPMLSRQLNDMKEMKGFKGLLSTVLARGQTPFKELTADVVAENGQISLKGADIHMDGAIGKMGGIIDVPNWRLKAAGQIALSAHQDAPPIGVNISGRVDKPIVTYQTDKLQKYVGGLIAANLLQQSLRKDNPGGGLQDLFGTIARPRAKEEEGPVNGPAAPLPDEQPPASSPEKDTPSSQKNGEKIIEDAGKLLFRNILTPKQQDNVVPAK
ncbi:MAG: hypothetical protein CMF31_03105 [Kordiimonas sp.]|nr:hypothetical protein [Kordiimonas sp.]